MKINKIIFIIMFLFIAGSIMASSSRLPTVGGDGDAWGTILNEYLQVEHSSDGTHGDLTVNSLDMENNSISNIFKISTIDGSQIRFGAETPFSGMDQAINIQSNQSLAGGVVTHLLTDNQGEKVIEAWQSGKNNSAGFHRNSYLIFGDQGLKNASVLTNALTMWNLLGINAEFDYNTADQGATLGVEYGIETQKIHIHDALEKGEFIGEGSFQWIGREGTDFDIYQVPLHILDTRVEEVIQSGDVDLFNINWNGEATAQQPPLPFSVSADGVGSSTEEWSTRNDERCNVNACIRAQSGDALAIRGVDYNFSTSGLETTQLSFYYGSDNMDATTDDNFSVFMNNYSGSGWIMIWNDTTTSADISPPILKKFDLPIDMSNSTLVGLRFEHKANLGIEETFLDDIKLNGSSGASINVNVSVGDAKIELGLNTGGTDSIFYNGSNNNLSITTLVETGFSNNEAYVCVNTLTGEIFAKDTACD